MHASELTAMTSQSMAAGLLDTARAAEVPPCRSDWTLPGVTPVGGGLPCGIAAGVKAGFS